MKYRILAWLVTVLLLISSCQMVGGNSISNNDYELGIGYGFLDKQVQVSVDGVPVLFLVGNEKMETFAQMQGTNMLYSGTSKQEEITVSVSVDGDQPIEKIIDLNDGIYIHVYQDITGVKIYNTSVLIFE